MTAPLTAARLGSLLEELLELEVLELLRCPEVDTRHLFIPYMLNDAIEQYLVLEQCEVMGAAGNFPAGTAVELTDDPQPGVILRRPDGTVATLWYQQARLERQLYQYHAIGHFWRSGQEHWRRLVYAVGTARDKQLYIGDEVCSEQERALAPLVHFAPFRYWSPIREPLADRYPDSREGFAAMVRLARKARDTAYLRQLGWYRLLRNVPMLSLLAEKKLALALTKPERKELYAVIFRELEAASQGYPHRDYPPAQQREMDAARQRAEAQLRAKGFTGSYPCFRRGCTQALAMEEHPFCIESMDYEGFGFGIKLMVSSTAEPDPRPNAGFFEGTGQILLPEEVE